MFELYYGERYGEDAGNNSMIYETTSAQQKIHNVFKYNEPPSANQKKGGETKKGPAPNSKEKEKAPGGAASNSKEKEVALRVPLCCAECEDTIIAMLTQVSGVKTIECDISKEKVVVKGSAANPADVLRTCRKLYKKSDFWE